MGERKPFIVYLLGVVNVVVGLVGLPLVFVVPGPGAVGAGLCRQLDGVLARVEGKLQEERGQVQKELELEESEVRREQLQARLRQLDAYRFPASDTSFGGLRGPGLGATYALLRLTGFVVFVAVGVSGFSLLLSQGRWARYLAVATGMGLVLLVVGFTAANLFLARPALGDDVEALVANTAVPGSAVDPEGLYPAVAELCVALLALLLGLALIQYPVALVILCLTEEVGEAFFA